MHIQAKYQKDWMKNDGACDDFWGRLGFFGWQKHFLEKRESSNAFSVPEGIIGVFVASMEYYTNIFKYPYFTFMN